MYYDDYNDICELEGSSHGTWENVGGGNYSTSSDGYTETMQVTFENNTFYYDDVDGADTYREVYIRN